jgi:hypothetical protein
MMMNGKLHNNNFGLIDAPAITEEKDMLIERFDSTLVERSMYGYFFSQHGVSP